MPIYEYECIYCRYGFEEFRDDFSKSGKSVCPKCGNVSFKIPSIFSPKIFKQRVFADGTKTPDFIGDYKQEKAWLKSQGITYDKPNIRRSDVLRERNKKSETIMEQAFAEAYKKADQGYKIQQPKHKKGDMKNAMRFKV